jgi:hypothetical protein
MRSSFRPVLGTLAAALMVANPTVSFASTTPAAPLPTRAEAPTGPAEDLTGSPLLIVGIAIVTVILLVLIFDDDDEEVPVSP